MKPFTTKPAKRDGGSLNLHLHASIKRDCEAKLEISLPFHRHSAFKFTTFVGNLFV